MMRLFSFIIIVMVVDALAFATEWYAAPSGTNYCKGVGSFIDPWDVHTVLWNTVYTNQTSHPIQPGDTVWLRGGTYIGHSQTINTTNMFTTWLSGLEGRPLSGTEAQPIILRSYLDEIPIFDGVFSVDNTNCWFWGLHITLSDDPMPLDLTREEQDTAVDDGLYRKGRLDVPSGLNLKFINCVIYDTYASSSIGGVGTEIYGCLLLYNGRFASDLPSGHGFYINKSQSPGTIVDNCVFANNFLNGLNLYGATGAGSLNNLKCINNVLFGNGTFVDTGTYNLLAGVEGGVSNIVLGSNISRGKSGLDPNSQQANLYLGYGGCLVVNPVVTNNILLYGGLSIKSNISGIVTNNRVYSYYGINFWGWGDLSDADWDHNTYQSTYSTPFVRYLPELNVNFATWQEYTSMEVNSTFGTSLPTVSEIIVQTNSYESDRANIIVINWGNSNNIPVNLSNTGLQANQRYELRVAQNYHTDVIYGTYTEVPIIIPMTNWGVRQPRSLILAMADETWKAAHPTISNIASTFPDFGVFILNGINSIVPTVRHSRWKSPE